MPHNTAPRPAKTDLITAEGFEALLSWLDRDREAAARKYEGIRERLIRILVGRGCFEAEQIADETFDRVTLKLPQIIKTYSGEPIRYFYAVAHRVHLEWLRKEKKRAGEPTDEIAAREPPAPLETDPEYDCLETCLSTLPQEQRRLIVEYYCATKRAKIDLRRDLAERLGISLNALQIKTSRIRTDLRSCIQDCMRRKGN